MLINEANSLDYNQSKATRLFIEAAYSKINSNSINRHAKAPIDIPPQ